MFFVGLDLSLRSTGFAVLRESGEVEAIQSFGSSLNRGSSMKDKLDRLVMISARIVDEIRYVRINGDSAEVCIENYAFGARGAQNDLGELHGVIKTQIYVGLGIVPTVVSPSSYRKVILGSGRKTKQESFDYAKSVLTKLGHASINADEADAYLVAEWLRRTTANKGEING